MRRAAAVTLIATGAVLAVTLSAGNEPRPKQPPTARQVVGFINHQRTLRSLPRLTPAPNLSRKSRMWSAHLARTGLFVHASLTLQGGWSWIAETLYRGGGGPVHAWLSSPPHRTILLSSKAELVGIGRTGNVWVGRFGRR